jgi:dCMP deaminase
MRPSWDEVWSSFAKTIASRSIDPRYKVGAVIVSKDNTQVLSIGYNGDQAGGSNSVESLEPGQSGCIHAEINALIKLDFNNPKKKIMYVTLSPCKMCSKAIINASIDEVVYLEEYRDVSGVELLKDSGIKVRSLAAQLENT